MLPHDVWNEAIWHLQLSYTWSVNRSAASFDIFLRSIQYVLLCESHTVFPKDVWAPYDGRCEVEFIREVRWDAASDFHWTITNLVGNIMQHGHEGGGGKGGARGRRGGLKLQWKLHGGNEGGQRRVKRVVTLASVFVPASSWKRLMLLPFPSASPPPPISSTWPKLLLAFLTVTSPLTPLFNLLTRWSLSCDGGDPIYQNMFVFFGNQRTKKYIKTYLHKNIYILTTQTWPQSSLCHHRQSEESPKSWQLRNKENNH